MDTVTKAKKKSVNKSAGQAALTKVVTVDAKTVGKPVAKVVKSTTGKAKLSEAMAGIRITPVRDTKRIMIIGRGQNKWAIVKGTSEKAYKIYPSKQAAVTVAKSLAKVSGGSIVVMDSSGEIKNL